MSALLAPVALIALAVITIRTQARRNGPCNCPGSSRHEPSTETPMAEPDAYRLAEFPRVWRPSKGMLRVLADNWGKAVENWGGRKVELYGDPNVYFGREKRGGTRIKRLSHITSSKTTLVNPRGGKGAYWTVDPLPDAPPVDPRIAELKAEWAEADEERRTQIRAEVAELQGGAA